MFPSFKYQVVIDYLTSRGFNRTGHKGNVYLWSDGNEQVEIPEGIDIVPGFHIGLILDKTKGTIQEIQMFDPIRNN